jgi:hypothetical protein
MATTTTTAEGVETALVTRAEFERGLGGNGKGKHVGDLVFWALQNAKMARADLPALLAPLGLANAIPVVPGPWARITTAATRTEVGKKHVLIRFVGRSGDEQTYAIIRENTDEKALDATYSRGSRVSANRKTGRITLEDPSDPIAQEIADHCRDLEANVQTEDVRKLIQAAITSWHGLALREGIYFVSRVHAEHVRQLQALVNGLGGSSMSCFRIADAEGIAQATDGVRDALADKLRVLTAELNDFLATAKEAQEGDGRALRSAGIRLGRWKEIREQVDFYAELLADKREVLLAQAEAGREALRALFERLGGDEGALVSEQAEGEASPA